MAYSFDNLSKKLDEDENQKQDIFAGEGSTGFGLTDTQQNNQQESSDPIEKTAGPTSLTNTSSTGTGASKAAPAVQQAPRGESEKRQATFNQQSKSTKLPAGLSSLGEQLGEKERALDTASSDYLSKYRQKDYGLDPDTISKATTGDTSALERVSGLLGQGTPGELPTGFEAPDTVTPGIQDIQSDRGLEQYLRRQAGPQYTSGEGAFDTSALARSAEFQQARGDLGRREAALGTRADELRGSLGGQASDILSENLGQAQLGVRQELGGIQRDVLDQLIQAKAAKQQELEDMRVLSPELAAQYEEQARSQLAAQSPAEAGLDPLLLTGDLGVDPSQFYSTRQAPITKADVATPEQAAQWNQILSLLGGGGETLTPADGGALSSFDQDAYQQALLAAAQKQYVPPAPVEEVVPAPVEGVPAELNTDPNANPRTRRVPTDQMVGNLELPTGVDYTQSTAPDYSQGSGGQAGAYADSAAANTALQEFYKSQGATAPPPPQQPTMATPQTYTPIDNGEFNRGANASTIDIDVPYTPPPAPTTPDPYPEGLYSTTPTGGGYDQAGADQTVENLKTTDPYTYAILMNSLYGI